MSICYHSLLRFCPDHHETNPTFVNPGVPSKAQLKAGPFHLKPDLREEVGLAGAMQMGHLGKESGWGGERGSRSEQGTPPGGLGHRCLQTNVLWKTLDILGPVSSSLRLRN